MSSEKYQLPQDSTLQGEELEKTTCCVITLFISASPLCYMDNNNNNNNVQVFTVTRGTEQLRAAAWLPTQQQTPPCETRAAPRTPLD